jgi:hypothetical protein
VRPNPPVGALGDKVRPATSYLTWATRARDRWFDLDAVRSVNNPDRVDEGSTPIKGRRGDIGSDGDPSYRPTAADRPWNPAGAPPLDWWNIPPKGYEGAHYAVYPPELCRIPIEASCPRRVCRTCGKPSRRETARSEEYAAAREAIGDFNTRPDGAGLGGSRSVLVKAVGREITCAENITTGWTTCGCPGADGIRFDGYHTGDGWRPGLVLDPFGGSGTTGVVASGLSRDCLLIDIDERNADLARERLGMFLGVAE